MIYWEVGTHTINEYSSYYIYDSSWSTRELAMSRIKKLMADFESEYSHYSGFYWSTEVDNTKGKFITKVIPHHSDITVDFDEIQITTIKRFVEK
jgi:hypothetical protein